MVFKNTCPIYSQPKKYTRIRVIQYPSTVFLGSYIYSKYIPFIDRIPSDLHSVKMILDSKLNLLL